MTTANRRFKDGVYEQVARIGKAVSAPKRLELLDLLCQSPRTVEALASECEISVANASQHLRALRAARLVEAKKLGLYVEYRLASPDVGGFVHALRTIAESRLLEIEQVSRDYFERRDTLEPVEREELVRRVRSGDVTLLDVRPAEEFGAGHIPGAISMPLDELEGRLDELPRRREIVAYCRGPYCVMALDATLALRKHGFRANRLEEGVLEWKARGYRVQASKEVRT